MNDSPVRVSDGRGFRHDPEDHEAVYQAWRATGRSLRSLEKLTGISKSTLGNWSKAEDWVARSRREDAQEADVIRASFVGMVTAQIVDSLATVIEIRDTEGAAHKDRLDAAKFLLGIAGISPVQKTQSAVSIADHAPSSQLLPEIAGRSIEQLMAIEAEIKSKR